MVMPVILPRGSLGNDSALRTFRALGEIPRTQAHGGVQHVQATFGSCVIHYVIHHYTVLCLELSSGTRTPLGIQTLGKQDDSAG